MSLHEFRKSADLRTMAGWVLFFLALGTTVIMAASMASARTSLPATVRTVAICTFDGGGMAVTGSVTRTDDGRAWLCTDDGNLVPCDLPVDSNGMCSMQGICAAYPYPLASR
jgi:hypothetical protein